MLREIFKPGMRLISRFVCACGLCVRECVRGGARVRSEKPESLAQSVYRKWNCDLSCQNTFKCTAPISIVSNGAHPASYTMGTGSFRGVKRPGHGVDHPHLVPRLRKEYSYTSTPLWAFVACSSVNFTFTLLYWSLINVWDISFMTQRNTEKAPQMNTLDQKKTLSQAVSYSRRNTTHNGARFSLSSTDTTNTLAVDSDSPIQDARMD